MLSNLPLGDFESGSSFCLDFEAFNVWRCTLDRNLLKLASGRMNACKLWGCLFPQRATFGESTGESTKQRVYLLGPVVCFVGGGSGDVFPFEKSARSF